MFDARQLGRDTGIGNIGDSMQAGSLMRGEIDTSFLTHQRDLFTSGMAAQIGMEAFGVWLAIKAHADYQNGLCWPGMRRLSSLTNLPLGSVHKCIRILIEARLLRVVLPGQGRRSARYVARERLDVRVGSRVLCTIVIDYVPAKLRKHLEKLQDALAQGKDEPELFAEADIIPGPGFAWDSQANMLRATLTASELPVLDAMSSDGTVMNDLQRKALQGRRRAVSRQMSSPVDNAACVHTDERKSMP